MKYKWLARNITEKLRESKSDLQTSWSRLSDWKEIRENEGKRSKRSENYIYYILYINVYIYIHLLILRCEI